MLDMIQKLVPKMLKGAPERHNRSVSQGAKTPAEYTGAKAFKQFDVSFSTLSVFESP
jgi:hypothetical protein